MKKVASMPAKYLNPYTDFGFKKLFAEEGSKDLLMDFLNQLLPSYHKVLSQGLLQFVFGTCVDSKLFGGQDATQGIIFLFQNGLDVAHFKETEA